MKHKSLPITALLCTAILHHTSAHAALMVQPVNAGALNRAIAARRGKVVLVNFWATWCVGCVEEFPGLASVQRKYVGKGLSVLFVSADDPGDRRGKVAPFLAQHHVSVPSFIIGDNTSHFVSQFDPALKSAFALPRTYLYNRQGKLVKVISQSQSAAQFEKLIKPLL